MKGINKVGARIVGPGLVLFLLLPAPLRADPPRSSCLHCHSEIEKSMEAKGPATLWPASIHAENGISCDSCHGGDPAKEDGPAAMNPARGFIGAPTREKTSSFCGRCHVNVRDHFIISKHATSQRSEKPNCVTCHTSHRQKSASVDLINRERCGACHGYEQAEHIKMALVLTDRRLAGFGGRILEMKYLGFDVRSLEQSLFAQRNRYHTLFHELSVPVVQEVSVKIAGDLNKIDQSLQGMESEESRRRNYGYVLVILFGLAAIATRLYFKTLH